LFDLWVYPIDEPPWSVSRIITENPIVAEALQTCIRKIPAVYFVTGNHDMQIKQKDLLPFSAGGKRLQLITPDWYSTKHKRQRHLEHGHAVDMFNAPDDSDDTIGNYPLGFFIARLLATAADPKAARQKLKTLLQARSYALRGIPSQMLETRKLGAELVEAIITVLAEHAKVEDNARIRFSEPELDNKVTVGQVKQRYGSLLGVWHERYPDPRELAHTMVACVAPHGLDWYAQNLLSGNKPPKVVLLGHTHHPVSQGGYVNGGCWCLASAWGDTGFNPSYAEVEAETAKLVFRK
jgi:UDP-2,3-diacylglucosamine pyrophosphatase LpxH